MPYRIKGIAGLRYTDEEMSVPRLSHNGTIVEGWVRSPGPRWQPSDGDLLWHPPNAVKSTDLDGIGRVVDVGPWAPGETMAWVQAEIDKSNRYWSYVRDKVRAGAYRMTAAAMRALGFDEDEIARLTGAELTPRTLTQGPVAAYKAAADREAMIARTSHAEARRTVEEGRRLVGAARIDPDTGLADVGRPDEGRVKSIAAAAAKKYAQTGDYAAAVAEVLAGVERTRGKA